VSAPRYRVVLVDDEPLGRATLRRLLNADPEVQLLAECAHGQQALEAVAKHDPELLFLDVQMPGMDGFEVLERLRARDDGERPVVVFTTAHDDYALKAFDVAAVDYLHKPFDDERFARALERAKARAREPDAEPGGPQHLTVHRAGATERVELAQVLWIESADQYVRIHTAASSHLLRESMQHMEQTLAPRRFLRVHRSALVALEHVTRVEATSGGTGRLTLDDGTELPVSRTKLPTLRERLREG
jgi:two-component system LytT family response regulator